MDHPVCTIVAGPNGAGKTTFALRYLSEVTRCRRFINADLIASGLSPLFPEMEQVAAGKLFLNEVRDAIRRGESFSFETTLAGRSNLGRIQLLRARGWRID
jgi:predicted ABC-type ATPase